MYPSVTETVETFIRISEECRQKIKNDPEFAKEMLIRIGILDRSKKSSSEVQLAKRCHSTKTNVEENDNTAG